MIGRILQDRYHLEAPLGQGAMGVVYRARDRKLGREVAVKLIHPALMDAERMERFLREAEALAALQHPNIVTIHDLGHSGDEPFLIMELVRGVSLTQLSKPTSSEQATLIARQICAALSHAHENQIVHRDLKPENVLLARDDGRVKLMDFGLSRMLDRPGMSQIGAGIGTCHYMAPEQVRGERVDGKADLYALGVILFELLTGKRPFAAESPFAVMHQHLHQQPPPLTDLAPPALAQMVQRLLAKAAADRPTAAEVSEQLGEPPVSVAGITAGPAAQPAMLSAVHTHATFLFTDIEGSARLWEGNPDAMRRALHRHDELVEAAIIAANGNVFKKLGDAMCAAFQRASEAVEAAVLIQRQLLAEPWPTRSPLRVRIGLHSGEAEQRSGDYFGDAVNRVARLMTAGHGGQTLLSESTQQLLDDRLPPDCELRDHGLHRLRNLARPERLFELRLSGLIGEFPPLRTLNAAAHNLPVELSSFIGREHELEELQQLLSSEAHGSSRLVSIVGFGGCGKTRLALQAAGRLTTEFPDGVWLVELAALNDPALLWPTVAQVLQVKEEPNRPLAESVADFLREKRLLLLLDNCEHLTAACAELVRHCSTPAASCRCWPPVACPWAWPARRCGWRFRSAFPPWTTSPPIPSNRWPRCCRVRRSICFSNARAWPVRASD